MAIFIKNEYELYEQLYVIILFSLSMRVNTMYKLQYYNKSSTNILLASNTQRQKLN